MRLSRLWLLGFIGYFLTIGAWSLATPSDGGPDELAHVLRAYSVVNGDVFLKPQAALYGTGAYHDVPVSLTRLDGVCFKTKPDVPAACLPAPGTDHTMRRVADPAGRYNPLYYAAVGLPLKIRPDLTGLLLARLIGAAMSAALLAAAMVSVVRFSRQRLMLGAFMLAATPMVVHIASTINPNGPEIAAGVAFFASGIPVLLGPARQTPPAWLLVTLAASAAVLVTVRSGGPLWLLVCVTALALPLRWAKVRDVGLGRPLRWVVVTVSAFSVASVLWIVVMKAGKLGANPNPLNFTRGQIAMFEFDRTAGMLNQLVGAFGYLDTYLPSTLYVSWQYPCGALVVLAFLVGNATNRWRLGIAFGVTAAASAILDMTSANTSGFVGQGRYLLPVFGGGLLLAAWVIEDWGRLTAAQTRTATRAAVLVTVPIQGYSLTLAMARFQHGLILFPAPHDYNPLHGRWHPAVGSVTPLVMVTLGLAVLALLGWLNATGPEPAPGSDMPAGGTDAVPAEAVWPVERAERLHVDQAL